MTNTKLARAAACCAALWSAPPRAQEGGWRIPPQGAVEFRRDGNAAARTEVSAIKVVAARLQTRVLDRAMQVFGAMGLSSDTPLAYLWTWGRAMRLLDGPDEVHLGVVARRELARARERRGVTADYLVPPRRV